MLRKPEQIAEMINEQKTTEKLGIYKSGNFQKETTEASLLNHRFYTTNFEEMASMDISFNEEEIRAVLDMTKLESIDDSQIKLLQFLQKLPLYLSNGWQFLQLYFMKPIDTKVLNSTICR